jgi:hypothetical protein
MVPFLVVGVVVADMDFDRFARRATSDEGEYAGLPTHYLFAAIPVGRNH